MEKMKPKMFNSQYRLATVEDFKYGMVYYTKRTVLEATVVDPVQSTGSLVKDASIFQRNVDAKQAYVKNTSKSKTSKSTQQETVEND